MKQTHYKQYQQTQVTTARKEDILIMLYEAAIRHSRRAQDCIDRKDLAGKGESILKVHDIVNELNNTLDHKVGGEIAAQLEQLYNYISEQLLHANLNNDKKALGVIEQILSTLLDGWRGAAEKLAQNGNAVK